MRVSKQLLKLAVFLALLFVIDRALGFVFSYAFERLDTHEIGGMINQSRREKAEILVIGSSRSRHHYDTAAMEKMLGKTIFNVGSDGHGTPYVRVVIDLILKEYSPELIILDVGPRFIMEKYYHGNVEKLAFLAPFWDDSPGLRKIISTMGPYQRLRYLSYAVRYNSMPLRFLRDAFGHKTTSKGYSPMYGTFTPVPGSRDIVEGELEIQNLKISDEAIALLRETIQIIKDRQIPIVLVSSPRWWESEMPKEYIQALSVIRRLSEEMQVPYLDLSVNDDLDFRDTQLYYDRWHLNNKGAALFSEILSSHLIEEGYIQKPLRKTADQ